MWRAGLGLSVPMRINLGGTEKLPAERARNDVRQMQSGAMKARPRKQSKPVPPEDSRLTVLWQVEHQVRSGKRYSQWLCQCRCGQTCKVLRVRIQTGHTRSCGCLASEANKRNIVIAKLYQDRQRILSNAQ
jgi:hypothetical protein